MFGERFIIASRNLRRHVWLFLVMHWEKKIPRKFCAAKKRAFFFFCCCFSNHHFIFAPRCPRVVAKYIQSGLHFNKMPPLAPYYFIFIAKNASQLKTHHKLITKTIANPQNYPPTSPIPNNIDNRIKIYFIITLPPLNTQIIITTNKKFHQTKNIYCNIILDRLITPCTCRY